MLENFNVGISRTAYSPCGASSELSSEEDGFHAEHRIHCSSQYICENTCFLPVSSSPWKLTHSNNNLSLMRQLNDAVLIMNISIFPLTGFLEIIVRFRVGKKCSESLLGSKDPQSCGNSLQRKSFSSRQQVPTKLGRIHRKRDGVPLMLSFYFFIFKMLKDTALIFDSLP